MSLQHLQPAAVIVVGFKVVRMEIDLSGFPGAAEMGIVGGELPEIDHKIEQGLLAPVMALLKIPP